MTSELRVLPGGAPGGFRLAGYRIAVAGRGQPPFAVQARVVEDDTYLVLGADPAYRQPTEHPLRVLTAAHEAEPVAPGSVVVRPGEPLRLHAVVHDLARRPTWTEAWIGSALRGVFGMLERRELRALALPAVGSRHGDLDIGRFLELLAAVLEQARPSRLERIWLCLPPERQREAIGCLHRAG